MEEMSDLRPSAPHWLKGIVMAEVALLFLIVEIRLIATVMGVAGVGALYLFVRGVLLVAPFGALLGALAPWARRRRTSTLTLWTLALLGLTGLVVLGSAQGIARFWDRTVLDVALGLALLVLPVSLASALFVRWTPDPPPIVDLGALLDTFE